MQPTNSPGAQPPATPPIGNPGIPGVGTQAYQGGEVPQHVGHADASSFGAQQPQVLPQQSSGATDVNGQIRPKINPNSTQNALQIAEIRDGIVIMNDGSFRAVVMCKSINFDLMSFQEREGIELAYQGFLNSLYFPIEILVRSRKVDVRPYLEKLDKIRAEHDNMLLSLLMEDYVYFMSDLAQQTNIMDKMFYIVIPYYNSSINTENITKSTKSMFGNIFNFNKTTEHVVVNEAVLEQAKTELRNRVQAVMQGLQQCTVQSLPLDTQELIELYYDSYNPDTSTRQQLKNFEDLITPIVTKGEGVADAPSLNRTVT